MSSDLSPSPILPHTPLHAPPLSRTRQAWREALAYPDSNDSGHTNYSHGHSHSHSHKPPTRAEAILASIHDLTRSLTYLQMQKLLLPRKPSPTSAPTSTPTSTPPSPPQLLQQPQPRPQPDPLEQLARRVLRSLRSKNGNERKGV